MGDRKPRPQNGAPRGVKRHQPLRDGNAEPFGQSLGKLRPDSRRAKPRAFHAEKRNLVEWIDLAEFGVEFQSVENHDPVGKIHMFRTKIAMAVDDATIAHTLFKQRAIMASRASKRSSTSDERP